MFAKLVDFVVQFVDAFVFLKVVKPWEVAVVLRLGRYARTLGPGVHWVWPLHIESTVTEWTVPYPRPLDPQPLTTRDGTQVVVKAIVTTRCTDAHKLVCESGGHENAVLDSATGTIAACVARATWAEVITPAFLAAVTRNVDEASRPWGLETLRVQFVNLSKARPICLVGPVGHKPTDL